MKSSEEYLVHLLRSVLLGEKSQEKPDGFSFGEVYRAAAFHNVDSMAFYGVDRLEVKPDERLYNEWKRKKDQCIILSFNQLHQCGEIVKKFRENNIKTMPLKGSLLKEMYPSPEYRQMADVDLLIESDKAQKAQQLMHSMGYTTRIFGNESVDEYSLPPYMNVEIHSRMVAVEYKYSWYYDDIWDKVIEDRDENGNPNGQYHLSWNDYYIYLLVHTAKHFEHCGTGIRSFMDIFVFMGKHRANIDDEYIDNELKKLDLCEFRKMAEKLAYIWFGDEEYDEKSREMEKYVFSSGAYGTFSQKIENHINDIKDENTTIGKAKVKYFFSRTFLKYEYMCGHYTILRKVPVLLPFCWIHRLAYALIHKSGKVRSEIDNINKIK